MLNNIELIKPFIDFNEKDDKFLFCQIIRRPKDIKDKSNHISSHRVLRTYFIRSQKNLEEIMPEIILLCEFYQARAYINLTVRSFKKLQTELLMRLSTNINNNCVCNTLKLLNSIASTIKAEKGNAKWVIDIDTTDKKTIEDVKGWILKYYEGNDYLYGTIPTLHGVHLITKPFNTQKFNSSFKDIEVKKNAGGTVLYIPDIIM